MSRGIPARKSAEIATGRALTALQSVVLACKRAAAELEAADVHKIFTVLGQQISAGYQEVELARQIAATAGGSKFSLGDAGGGFSLDTPAPAVTQAAPKITPFVAPLVVPTIAPAAAPAIVPSIEEELADELDDGSSDFSAPTAPPAKREKPLREWTQDEIKALGDIKARRDKGFVPIGRASKEEGGGVIWGLPEDSPEFKVDPDEQPDKATGYIKEAGFIEETK